MLSAILSIKAPVFITIDRVTGGLKEMFEPESEGIICPKCYRREIYFDSKIGHYCMFCGRQFSTEEVEMLREHEIYFTTTSE